jgi:hypothetical protein
MNKIIQQLLVKTFPTMDITSLMEVINATDKPEIATEILCGIYVAPETGATIRTHEGRGTVEFKGYDKWKDEISCTYQEPVTKSGYFPKETDRGIITLENFDTLKVPYSSNTISVSIKTEEFRLAKYTCSLETWLQLPVLAV